jgi:predicted MFS family arabinose efflux permease
MQQAVPDLPEAGSALFVGIIQVAIASGSLIGGTVVDRVGIPADFWFGSALALLGLAAVGSFGTIADKGVAPASPAIASAAAICGQQCD